MKKCFLGILLTGVIGVQSISVWAKEPIRILFDNKVVQQNDAIGFAYKMDNGCIMLPLRLVVDELGYQIGWNSRRREATLTKEDKKIEIRVDSTGAKVDGVRTLLDTPAEMKNGKMYIPINFVDEEFGVGLAYAEQTVNVFTDGKTIQFPSKEGKKEALKLEDIAPYLINNGYSEGQGGINYTIYDGMTPEGRPSTYSVSQVAPEMGYFSIRFIKQDAKSVALVEDLLARLMPSKGKKIYQKAMSEEGIPVVEIYREGGKTLAIDTKDTLHMVFDFSKGQEGINLIKQHEQYIEVK